MDKHEHAELLARLAHDLRGPLSGLLGIVQTLRRRSVEPDTLADFLGRAEGACRRMDALITDILTMAELDTGGLQLRIGVVDPAAVMQEAVAGIVDDVDLAAPSEPLPTLTSDGTRLAQILERILDNATRYSASPPQLSALAEDGVVRFTVSDHGPGVPPGEAERIFERFYQVPTDRTRGRSGLGLAVAAELATALGAAVRLEPPGAGEGARFTLEVPVR